MNESRSTTASRPQKPRRLKGQAVDMVDVAFAPQIRAQAQGGSWSNSEPTAGKNAQARPQVPEASETSRISGSKESLAPKKQSSCGHLIWVGALVKKVIANDGCEGNAIKSYGDDGVALEVVGHDGRSEGESRLDGKLTAIFAGDAIGRVHRKPRRKIGDKISFLSRECIDRMTVVALTWRLKEAVIC
ncbi:MAG: hypothetical protein LC674_04520 [Actinobacteria bacterium]|nr:hypothetical protein [Actinomycetota bacterium]